MPENIQKYIERAGQYLESLSTQKKLLLASIAVLMVVGIGVSVLSFQKDDYKMLYRDLQADESRAIAQKLGEMQVPYVISPDGSMVSVPESKVATSRMELAKKGIPGQDVVGFEKFDSSTLGMSSYVQRIQYIRAVQGELIRSIERLQSVKRARVHISIPPKKTFLEDQDPPKASVVLDLPSGKKPDKSEINGIAHLVASAVEGLKIGQISIVDTKGNFLHRPGEDTEIAQSNALLEQQRIIEREYEQRLEDILIPVVGPGKVKASVSVELDASRVNMTEETFDAEKTAIKSNNKTEETMTGSRPNPIGIPGSRSNLPGTEAQEAPIPTANTNSEKVTNDISYSVPRKITVTDKPSGNIKRLTVAVVVDGKYETIPGGTEKKYVPRSEEELKRIEELVANSIGYDTGRRDSLSITSMQFTDENLVNDELLNEGPWWKRQEVIMQVMRNGLIALLILGFFFFVVRPFMKWSAAIDKEAKIESLPKTVEELESEGIETITPMNGESDDTPEIPPVLENLESLEKREEEELKKEALDQINKAPKKGIQIIKDWIEGSSEKQQVAS